MEQSEPVVDVSFQVVGNHIPADHGYALFAAVSRHLPWLHGDESAGIHPIRGQLSGQRQLALTPQSRLVLRLPAARLPPAIALAGQRLELDGSALVVGVPTVRPLVPRAVLASRLVVIKGFTEAEAFLAAARRQLAEREVAGSAALVPRRRDRPLEGQVGGREPFVRRTLRIREREVVGFALLVSELDAAGSLRLQSCGLGGRRRFGCGLFVPAPESAG